MFGGLLFLFGFLAIGELISTLGVGLPGNVIGMVLLTVGLAVGVVKPEQVRSSVDVLLDNLAFLFVPPGVGIMVHAGLIADNWVAIVVAILISTLLVLVVVGGIQQLIHRRRGV